MDRLEKIALESRASQDAYELLELLRVVTPIRPQVIVEIGVHNGYSMETWNKAFRPSILIGIDNETAPGLEVPAGAVVLKDDSHHPAAVTHLKNHLGAHLIDFLFIDGDHTYEGVKSDWDMYSPLVRPGGIVALHDTNRIGEKWVGRVETRRLFDELMAAYDFVTLTGKYRVIDIFNGERGDERYPGVGVVFV